jgi:hypothetical protein
MSENTFSPTSQESKYQAERILNALSLHLNLQPLSLGANGVCSFTLIDSFSTMAWINNQQPRLDLLVTVGKLPGGSTRAQLLTDMMVSNLGTDGSVGTSIGLHRETGNITLNNSIPLSAPDTEVTELVDNIAMLAESWRGTMERAEASAPPTELPHQDSFIRA